MVVVGLEMSTDGIGMHEGDTVAGCTALGSPLIYDIEESEKFLFERLFV